MLILTERLWTQQPHKWVAKVVAVVFRQEVVHLLAVLLPAATRRVVTRLAAHLLEAVARQAEPHPLERLGKVIQAGLATAVPSGMKVDLSLSLNERRSNYTILNNYKATQQ